MNFLAAFGFSQPKFNCRRIITIQKIWIVLIQIPNNHFCQFNKTIGQIPNFKVSSSSNLAKKRKERNKTTLKQKTMFKFFIIFSVYFTVVYIFNKISYSTYLPFKLLSMQYHLSCLFMYIYFFLMCFLTDLPDFPITFLVLDNCSQFSACFLILAVISSLRFSLNLTMDSNFR